MFNALFSFQGRLRRRDWWLWSITTGVLFYLATSIIDNTLGSGVLVADEAAFKGFPDTPFEYWLVFATMAGQFITYCLTAKRWHDRNRPGWFAGIGAALNLLYFGLVHFGAGLDASLDAGFATRFGVGMITGGIFVGVVIYGLWVLIDCGILDGTPGKNTYGPSPKGLGFQQSDVF